MNKPKKSDILISKIISYFFFIFTIILILCSIVLIIGALFKNKIILSIFFTLLGILSLIILKYAYIIILIENRKSTRWCPPLSNEELKMIEDAKELIMSVDNNISISKFNVYKIRFLKEAWFYYDEFTNELTIFIPFNYILKLSDKNLCFSVLLHEILHSQNLKNNINIFTTEFLEGLNEFFTHYLIQNYSKKYNLPKNEDYNCYKYEEEIIKQIFEKCNLDLKRVFLEYIDFNPDFFKSFVPEKYFLKD